MLAETYCESCIICGSTIRHWRTVAKNGGEYAIDRCADCGFAFVNPRPSPNFIAEFYRSGQSRADSRYSASETYDTVLQKEREFPNVSLDSIAMLKVVRHVSTKSNGSRRRFLDVGCGFGFFVKEAMKHGFEVAALEPGATESNIVETMTGVKPIPVIFEEFSEEKDRYDVVLMSHVLEHALDINEWISKASDILKPGGTIAIALPNFNSIFRRLLQERDPYVIPPNHLNYFSSTNLSLLLKRHGFVIRKKQWVSRLPHGTVEKRLAFLGQFGMRTANIVKKPLLSSLDMLQLGIMIRVYATR